MPMSLRGLLQDNGLGLRLRTGAAGADRIVRWVAVTELADPTPWMTGGELILTTGLRQRTTAAQTAFVQRVAAAGASGIGFGTGLSHTAVPRATVAEAERQGLAVLEVPYETPFIAISRLVAERLAAEDHSAQRRLVDQHDLLVQALLSGGGLTALLRILRRCSGAEAAVIDRHGTVLAAAPERADALVEEVRAAGLEPAGDPGRGGPLCLPVLVDGAVTGFLCLRAAGDAADVLPYAVRLIGLELARRQARLAGRRELVGQVLEDVVRDVIAPAAAERRLAALGLDVKAAHRVVLGCLAADAPGSEEGRRLARLPWTTTGRPGSPEPVLTAVVNRYLVAVLPQTTPVDEPARRIGTALSALDARASVGIGGCYRGVDGLRWSWFEAQAALAKGPGIHGGDPLDLPRLLLAHPDLPLKQLGAEVLRPLTEFDDDRHGDLVLTLRAYLAADCSVQAVADQLYVHRNTVRYWLDQIERLTGRSLQSLQDRFHLWLALLAAYPDGGRSAPA
ncbi:PucR family transcriptional regulator [Kitasatospora acidiphila]|uniref:PucR family transcriptional regulator n=1 Tax=Kitasatospora acidiphila TaxID=2567942 RepID=A0A540WCP5_9ACTN|nr:PucR family transcriptional regulator [Kitasatospora acidiphila]TQF06194.1 PucR family transcriptional regulator [Kitasatospora acidiphila]